MRIWYQSYSAIGFDPRWAYYEEHLARYVREVARPTTEVSVHGVPVMAPRMVNSRYLQHLHARQVHENALLAERQGYDAFVLGGMLDLGYHELQELLTIPAVFIAETSFHVACLLSPNFSVVAPNEAVLRGIEDRVADYGLQRRYVPGVHLGGKPLEDLVASFADPRPVLDQIEEAAREVIARGARMIVPGFGALNVFLVNQGVRDCGGIPVLDNTAVLIKMAEARVDLHRLGTRRGRRGPSAGPSQEDVRAARSLYGLDEGRAVGPGAPDSGVRGRPGGGG